MGLFDKFKKASTDETNQVSIFDTDYPLDKSDWFQVFSACVGKVMTIQNACSEQVVKGQNWNVDFTTQKISFGKDSYPVQFIGSESSSSNTWKWGWDNINGFNDNLIQLAHECENFGTNWNLEAFNIADFELDDTFNGHNLSIIACGLSKNKYCYYRGPHDGGAIFMAFSGVPDSVFAPVGAQAFVSMTTQCIQQFSVDHKIFIESYLLWNGTKYDWNNETIIAHFDEDLVIQFENADGVFRITSMKTTLTK